MRLLRILTLACALAAAAAAAGAVAPPAVYAQNQTPARPEPVEEFVPIDQLPPQEQLPAAPLLVGAYVFVLLTLFGYMFMMSRRITVIQREVDRLDNDLKRSGRS